MASELMNRNLAFKVIVPMRRVRKRLTISYWMTMSLYKPWVREQIVSRLNALAARDTLLWPLHRELSSLLSKRHYLHLPVHSNTFHSFRWPSSLCTARNFLR